MNRAEILSQLRSNPKVSVLIVGGGINGVGTFRDLGLNGVDVLLVDRADFCSGASAASSHMAHGGIRYLENGEFRLVREAVGERNRMLKNAAHIVKPLPTTIPIFKYFSGVLNAPLKFFGLMDKPAERGSVIIKLGLMLYDAYTGSNRTVPIHKFFSRNASLSKWKKLNPQIVNAAVYYDGLISNPERLAIEALLDGEAENQNARAVNYMSMVSGEGDKVFLRDELTDEMYEAHPKLLINAAGAWIDFTNHSMGLSSHFIGGTKGSHLVLNHPEIREAIGENEFFFENKDGRIVLICPLFDRVLIGTSDIKIENPDEAECTDEEIDYFIELVSHVFPSIRVTREHIVFVYTGVRPLGSSGAKTTSQYSRDHSIEVLSGDWTNLNFPVYSLVGGKWTSFRAFAEQVTDKALDYLGMPRQKNTRELPIGGGCGYSDIAEEQNKQIDALAAWTGLSKEHLQTLYQRYGARIEVIAEFIHRGEDARLKSLPDFTKREIAFLAQNEKALHLDDLLLRRTMIAMLGRATKESIQEIADVMGDALGWNDGQKNAEVNRTIRLLRDRHKVRL